MSCSMILNWLPLCLGTKLDLLKEKNILSTRLEIYKIKHLNYFYINTLYSE